MSDGDALRAAIRSAPTDATVRLVYADWLDENDQPGGDLVRLLVGSSLWPAVPQVVEWFHQRHGWPMRQRFMTAHDWLREVLDPRLWSDPEQLRACLIEIARRMLPVGDRGLPHDHIDVLVLAVTSRSHEVVDLTPPGRISDAAARVAELCLSAPEDSRGDAADREYCEQVHIVAWTWLDLPPLRPAPPPVDATPPEPPVPPAPDQRSWWRRLFGG